MARFIDLFVLGDGEEALPAVCDLWLELKRAGRRPRGGAGRDGRPAALRLRAAVLRAAIRRGGRAAGVRPLRSDVPEQIEPAVVADLDAFPLPTAPVVPHVECVQDRIAIEIMRGCPWQCRFCQSTTTQAAGALAARWRRSSRRPLEAYRNTGYNEISLLGLSTSDYPQIEELLRPLAGDVPAAGREHLAAQPADQPAIALAGRPAEHRPPRRPDAGPRGGPRRHAPAGRQADHQRRPVRGLPPGDGERLQAGEAVLHVRPAGRTAQPTWTASWRWPRRSPGWARR